VLLLLLIALLLLLLLLLLFSVVVELAEFYALRRALLLVPIAPLPELFYLENRLFPFVLVVYLLKLSLFSYCDISGILLPEEV